METTPEGLSTQEAQKRIEIYGENGNWMKARKNPFSLNFLKQFKDFMIIVLLVAAVISAVFSHDVVDSVIILLVVVLNAIFG